MSLGIVWFRRDLRLQDNPALAMALANHEKILALYVHAPQEQAPWSPGAASDVWLHHALVDLDERLVGRLLLRQGGSLAVIDELVSASGAEAVYWNRLYEPAAIARDTELKRHLRERGTGVHSGNAALLFEPWEVEKKAGGPFRVFTPFWKRVLEAGLPQAIETEPPATGRLHEPAGLGAVPLETLGLLPSIRWDRPIVDAWQPSRGAGEGRLDEFLASAIEHYPAGRDHPARDHVSRLSPYLHFGQLGPRELVSACGRSKAPTADFLRELGWREFAHHLLFHYPHTADQPLDRRFDGFPWRDDPAALAAWQLGQTGIPLVDAGMRQLWSTGWMHNRVRMIVASFLTKNLLLPWQDGARWFWDTLVDADLASNSLGWQWTAGCGADAAPYFRVFNPVLQGEKFDPRGAYVREWVPALRDLPDKWVHRPWEAPDEVLAQAGISLGREYPRPLVDLKESRLRALDAWSAVK